MSAVTGPERRTIASARELASLSDAGIYARFGAGSVSPVTAYARAIAEAQRLLAELADITERSGGDAVIPPPGAPAALAQLAEIRLVLEAFDWETDDRQYALEQIDGIVHQGAQDHACPAGTFHFSDHGEIYAAHPDGTAHVVGRSQP